MIVISRRSLQFVDRHILDVIPLVKDIKEINQISKEGSLIVLSLLCHGHKLADTTFQNIFQQLQFCIKVIYQRISCKKTRKSQAEQINPFNPFILSNMVKLSNPKLQLSKFEYNLFQRWLQNNYARNCEILRKYRQIIANLQVFFFYVDV